MEIKDFMFKPATLKVKTGATIMVTNRDDAAHTFTADDKSFDTGTLSSGASKSVTVTKAGAISYKCGIHNYMTGVIQVTA